MSKSLYLGIAMNEVKGHVIINPKALVRLRKRSYNRRYHVDLIRKSDGKRFFVAAFFRPSKSDPFLKGRWFRLVDDDKQFTDVSYYKLRKYYEYVNPCKNIFI